MQYDNLTLKHVQKIQTKILQDIDKICKANNIEYFIIGGTALGAKRHNGFIPWDDDIDIGMTRDNYDKFLRIANGLLPSEYFLQTIFTDKYTPFAYAKIRMNNTKFVEWCNRDIDMHKGIYIDVFPYDNIPDVEKNRRKQYNKVQSIHKLYVLSSTPDVTERPKTTKKKIKRIVRKIIYLALKPLPKKWLYEKLNKEMSLYNNVKTKNKACLLFPKYMVEYMDLDTLYPLNNVRFENLIVPAPNDINKYLTNHYGEYMVLPPKNQRVGHKPYILEIGR